ncbi:MAG: CpaF family protein [Vampirovibrionales bacterium]|nr:CpaF family protein [Vampirovibrionales bacterium]
MGLLRSPFSDPRKEAPLNEASVTDAAIHATAETDSSSTQQLSQHGEFTASTIKAEEPTSVEEISAWDDKWDGLKHRLHQRLMEAVDIPRLMALNPTETHEQIRIALGQLIEGTDALLSYKEKQQLIDGLMDDILGLGPLEVLLKDTTVNDILINGPYNVFVERKGKLVRSHVRFKDDKHLLQVIDRIVAAVGRRVDESQPLCDARLKDGSRFNCIIPPLALDGALVSIRKFSKDPLKVEDLIQYGTLNKQAAELLKGFVEARLNIIISGSTGSGKTTMLNVLSSFIPDDERIVTIEDAAELQLQKDHVARMETRPANIEGRGEITMRDLFKNALRMRPERIVVGECRSGEALDMLQAMNTGHDGSLTTLHANNPRDALRRLETMVLMAGYDLPARAIREQVASAVHVILQVSRLSDGSRKVMNITEVVGMEGDVILLQDIYKFVQTGVDENKKVLGRFEPTGIRPKFLEHLEAAGIAIDPSIFSSSFNALNDGGWG